MFKSLLGVVLLIPSFVSNIYKEEDKKPVENLAVNTQVFGSYNLYDSYADGRFKNPLNVGPEAVRNYTIDFWSGHPIYSSFVNIDNSFYFLKQIDIHYEDSDLESFYVDVGITWYTDTLVENFTGFTLCNWNSQGNGIELNPNAQYGSIGYTQNNFIIYCGHPILISDEALLFFNLCFTPKDNSFTYTYSGYYNFLTTTTIPVNCNMYGSVIYDSSWYYGLNHSTGGANNTFSVYYSSIDYSNTWLSRSIDFPTTDNILLSGCKMTKVSFDRFRNYGVFQYVADPSEQADFHDMIFTVMDAPIYFLSSLLSFELFGVNMFIAFTGLLTLVMILLLIRKFF